MARPAQAMEPIAGAPDAEACRAQLARVLASAQFDATERDRRFLAHVVEEALAGRAERIKAYTIATEVFGRDASFDPQTDPIVRVEAGHLRRALDRYYLSAGRADPVVITIPKGGYAPAFAPGAAPLAAAEPPAAEASAGRSRRLGALAALAALLIFALGLAVGIASQRRAADPTAPDVPGLRVEPFADLSPTGDHRAVAEGLTQELVGQVSKFKDLVVVDSRAAAAAGAPSPRYALAGSIALEAAELRVQARILSLPEGRILWADSFLADLGARRLMEIEDAIAGQVATVVGQPYGVIFQADAARRAAGDAPDDWQAYSCTLSYYAYRARLDPASHAEVRACLDQAVARFPDYATAWALLAQIHADAVRFHYPGGSTLDAAEAAARRALEIDPLNVRGLQARMQAMFIGGDLPGALRVGAQALAINPNDTELMGEYGYRLAMSGDWGQGCRLVETARARNPGPLGYFESALALCAYIAGDYPRAATWIRQTAMIDNPGYHLIAAAIFAEAGRPAAAAAERDWLLAHAPEYLRNARADIGKRVGRPEDFARFLASLEKAGIPPGGSGR